MQRENVYLLVGLFGGVNIILALVFGSFLPIFYNQMDELGNQSLNTNLKATYHNFLFGNLARVFGIVAVCSFLGLIIYALLNTFRREPEEVWQEL